MKTQITFFFFLKNENEHELYVCLHFVAEYGMGLEISTAGDVYSYGVILLEMIMGRRPTDGPFEGGLSLHGLVQDALPRDVSEVLDGGLVVVPPHHDDGDGDKAIILGCVERLAELGLRCAADSPGDRPTREAFSSALEVSAAHG